MHDQRRQLLSHKSTARVKIDQLEGPADIIIQSWLWHALELELLRFLELEMTSHPDRDPAFLACF